MKYHITKQGEKIKLKDLETTHLINIIKWIERKSKHGLKVGISDHWHENMWYEEETYYGDDVKDFLNYSDYIHELNRRKKQNQIK